jgi:mono/diheme cytochrome c family protein
MVDLDRGCLGEDVGTAPDFRLDEAQRRALGAFLAAMDDLPPPSPRERVSQVMATWNCYACHERDGQGGVPEDRDRLFLANREDLGEEGRLPPSLDGVGDRLAPDWLARVLGDGVAVRTYMATRMPRFSAPEVEALARHYRALDRQPSQQPGQQSSELPDSADDEAVREAGRLLVGEGGMNCILCHDFHRREAPTMGVHDLITTTERLNEEWFVRYLKNPERYHPGTRMPNFWPFSRSAVTDVLDGDADRQIRAIWTYLSDGDQAVDPEGLSRQNRELIVGGHAVVYRGKFWEAGWRGIAVGYPSGLNLVFDAENLRLALVWKGRFLDVSRHWNVQGMGLIRPLGEAVRVLPGGRPFAVLASEDSPWPQEQGWRTAPYRFQGYDLDRLGHPTFRYQYMGVAVEDRPEVRVGDDNLELVRTLSFTAEESVPEIWFRLARGDRIEQIDRSTYRIDGELTVRIPGLRQPVIATAGDNELRLPLAIPVGVSELVVEYIW